MKALTPQSAISAPALGVRLVTLAAVLLLGVTMASWTWTWFGPRPVASSPAISAGEHGVPLAVAYGLFGKVARDRAGAAPTGMAIRLLGVAAASAGRGGYAVVQLDGKQIFAVREGEDVAPGIRLAEVHPEQVILERNGTRESLAWPQKRAPLEGNPARDGK